MQTDHSKVIRGLSIAAIVLAGLTILVGLGGLIALGIGSSALSSVTPEMLDYYYDYDYGYGYGHGHAFDLDYDDAYFGDSGTTMALAGLALSVAGVLLVFGILCGAVALVAGIMGLRFFDQRQKMNLVFGWSLAGAICSLISGNMVLMALLIIVCVFAYKDKQLTSMTPAPVNPIPASNVTTTTVPPAAPAATAQSAQPVAPAQPSTPAVPAQPAAPSAPATPAQPATPSAPATPAQPEAASATAAQQPEIPGTTSDAPKPE